MPSPFANGYIPPMWVYEVLIASLAFLTVVSFRRRWYIMTGIAAALTLTLLGDIGAILTVAGS